jgi:HTH-type transcriptional regulator/antitoxin HigA
VFKLAGHKYRLVVWINYSYRVVYIRFPDPVEAIKFVMDQRGLTVKDLEPMIGRSNRVYEVLSRKRPLTLKMIWKLHKGLGIPAESLIKQPDETQAA